MSDTTKINYLRARKRAIDKLVLCIHATVYIIVNIGLITINLIKDPQLIWFVWPLLGWGFGLGVHCIAVYLAGGSSQILRHMIHRELSKERNPPDLNQRDLR